MFKVNSSGVVSRLADLYFAAHKCSKSGSNSSFHLAEMGCSLSRGEQGADGWFLARLNLRPRVDDVLFNGAPMLEIISIEMQ